MEYLESEGFWIPESIRAYLTSLGFSVDALEAMEPYIRAWDRWMAARGRFYDYHDKDGMGRRYRVHRRSIMPAMRVCKEWGALLLNEETKITCEDERCTEYLADYFARTGFFETTQETIVQAFGRGTGAMALWFDLGKGEVRVRHTDARMLVPLTWDDDGISECAFVTTSSWRGKQIDQLQMHVRGGLQGDGDASISPGAEAGSGHKDEARSSHYGTSEATYHIITKCFDSEGREIQIPGIIEDLDTGSTSPTFAIIKPAVLNTRVDLSPYGQSVFADAIDAIQAVDLTFDALINEIDLSKMRIFLSDVMFDTERSGKKNVEIPFGKNDCTVFRKVMSTDDVIQEFAPALRTEAQAEAFRISLQMLGDLCGFGITYFDFDNSGYVKTATEVSSDNSALMRNIRHHENQLQGALVAISKAILAAARFLGEELPDEGVVTVTYDDAIIQDTSALKAQDMAELNVTMHPWEYRKKWYGEDEKTAKARSRGLGVTYRAKACVGDQAAQ